MKVSEGARDAIIGAAIAIPLFFAGCKKAMELVDHRNAVDSYENQGYSREEALREILAHKEIQSLPTDLKAIAVELLNKGCSPSWSLQEARAYGEIQNLSPDFKAYADSFLNDSYHKFTFSSALKEIQARQNIQTLSPDLRSIAYEYEQKARARTEDWEYFPTYILEQVEAYGKIQELPADAKAIAEKRIKIGYSHSGSLEQARAYEEIQKLPEDLRVIADKFSKEDFSFVEGLNEARAYGEIQDLHESLKVIADQLLEEGHRPTVALIRCDNHIGRVSFR